MTAEEWDCLLRYRRALADRLGEDLVEVRLFGSAARGEMWPLGSPMHSDLDLLVLTRSPVPEALRDELVGETYPLFLECGRQLSPQFLLESRFRAPDTEVLRDLASAVARDGLPLPADDAD